MTVGILALWRIFTSYTWVESVAAFREEIHTLQIFKLGFGPKPLLLSPFLRVCFSYVERRPFAAQEVMWMPD